MFKRIFSSILAVALIFLIGSSNVSAASDPTIRVSSITAKQGETVTLKVSISDNPGINTFTLGFDYDSAKLLLTNVSVEPKLGGQFVYSKKAVWFNNSDLSYNGDILTLSFTVLSSASTGDTSVAVTYKEGDISNYNENNVNFNLVSGKIRIEKAGDATGSLAVSSENAKPGDTVDLKVTILNNPGINTFSLGFDYDSSKIELMSATVSEELGGQFVYSKKAVWLNNSDTKYNGEILTLTFKVLENVEKGDAEVGITYAEGDISNYNEEDVSFSVSSGFIHIEKEEVIDENAPKLVVSNAKANLGKTVDVTVSLANNPGIIGTRFTLSYDKSKLELTAVKNGTVFDDTAFTSNNDITAVPFTVYWEDALASSNNTSNGVLVTFTFKVLEDAEIGTTPVEIAIDSGSTFNYDLDNVKIVSVNGSVEIANRTPGDVNGDGVVNSKDLVILKRYLANWKDVSIDEKNADVNGDGVVNTKDVVILKRYLADWNVTLI